MCEWTSVVLHFAGRHEVPETAPDKALDMLNHLLKGKPF
jgi:hypothetical protein